MSADPRIVSAINRRRRAHEREEARTRPVEPAWEPCGFCWGQRRIWTPNGDGSGLTPYYCPRCLGIGDVPSVGS